MKNYNWLLWGALGYLAFRYLKKKNVGATSPSDTAPQELQPFSPAGMPNKTGSTPAEIVSVPFAVQQRSMQVPVGSPVPPSQGFKPGTL